jgi:hypothetical protein
MKLAAPYFLASSLSVAAPALNQTHLLDCIAQVEGHVQSDLGGRYGIRLAVWRDNSRLPYALSRRPEYADAVARKHLAWLGTELDRRGMVVTPYTLASAWNLGLEGFIEANQRGWIDYGQRVANLFYR